MLGRLRMVAPFLALLCFVGAAHGQILLPAGSSFSLNGGRVSLAGVDIDVAGHLSLGSGELVDAGSLHLQPGGRLDLGIGRFQLAGDWNNAGEFDAEQGLVEFIDGQLPVGASIRGANSFFDLSIVSASGKRYRLETGRTQIVAGLLTLRGEGAPLQIDTTAGPVAVLRLALETGTQAINNVGVSDVYATGQALASAQSNQGGAGNHVGWFGVAAPVPMIVPTGSWLSGLLLVVALTVVGGFALGRRQQ